jgi:GntR family transcriptional regulator, arabinose operon transcriptional repressor
MSDQLIRTSKHLKIRQWILDSIKNGSVLPGDKLPSESEMCEKFSASRSSVRQAITTLAGEGWLKSQRGVGTFCARKDKALTMDVGLICYFSSSYIFPRIARGCDQVAHRRGFHILLNQSEYNLRKEEEILRRLQKRGVDGIIIEPVFDGTEPSNLAVLEELDRAGIPLVLLDNYFPASPFTRVALDDAAAGCLVAAHLWRRGHRRIAIVHDAHYLPKKLRKEGAMRFLADAGAPVCEEWLISYEGPVAEGNALRLLDAFLSRGDLPSAFICTSDEEAMELYKAAEGRGLKIPQDLSVISFDNSSMAELPGISLTSVDHPGLYMGELATQLLLEKVLNPGVACQTVSLISPRLVERGSVRTISGNAEEKTLQGGNV